MSAHPLLVFLADAYFDSAFGGGTNLWFVNNTCVFVPGSHGYDSDCDLEAGMEVSGNALFVRGGNLSVCRPQVPFAKWQAEGHDRLSTLHDLPTDNALIAMGRALLGIQG